ncbi:MAG: hypothetical protein ABW092_03995 [Candidatus Thiodiazotropha sp.]
MKEVASILWALLMLFHMYDLGAQTQWATLMNFGVLVVSLLPAAFLILLSYTSKPPECLHVRMGGEGVPPRRAIIYIELIWKLSTGGLYATLAFFIIKLGQDPEFDVHLHQPLIVVGLIHLILAFILLILMYIRAKQEAEEHAE